MVQLRRFTRSTSLRALICPRPNTIGFFLSLLLSSYTCLCPTELQAQVNMEPPAANLSGCQCDSQPPCQQKTCSEHLAAGCYQCPNIAQRIGQLGSSCNTGCNARWIQERLRTCGCPPQGANSSANSAGANSSGGNSSAAPRSSAASSQPIQNSSASASVPATASSANTSLPGGGNTSSAISSSACTPDGARCSRLDNCCGSSTCTRGVCQAAEIL